MTTEPIILTLPGAPVTRAVTWDMVRAYLRADGWAPNPKTAPESRVAMWERPGTYDVLYVGGTSEREEHNVAVDTVRILARLVAVSPGEMLARIADSNLSPEEDERRRLLGMDREPPDVPRCCRCATRHPTGTKCYGAP